MAPARIRSEGIQKASPDGWDNRQVALDHLPSGVGVAEPAGDSGLSIEPHFVIHSGATESRRMGPDTRIAASDLP